MSEFDPGEIEAARQAQAARVRDFLTRLATDDAFLVLYVKDRIGVMQKELDAGRLTLADVVLLIEGNCCDVNQLLSGGAPLLWIRASSWYFGV